MKKIFKFLMIAAMALPLVAISCNKEDETTKEEEQEEQKEDTPKKKSDYEAPEVEKNPIVDYTKWEIKDGKFYLDGKWVFLKIGKPLINYADANAVNDLISKLETYRQMHFNAMEFNCYWHHFDTDGDGVPDVSLEPLKKIIEATYNKGMYPCLTVETYSVGGGNMPSGFFEKYPDARAIAPTGKDVTDTEYGFGSAVVSIFHEQYRENVHTYIKSLASAINTDHVLWFETTVEPQYMGAIPLCYSESARKEYNKWREENGITDAASEMPTEFPISNTFQRNATWNKFRAQFLAKWINEDAAAYRSVAGEDAYVAVDYLETSNSEMYLRNGDSEEFLKHLTSPNIIQINWHFKNGTTHAYAYNMVKKIDKKYKRNWVIAEHMTLNGDDFNSYYSPTEASNKIFDLLDGTLKNGTRMGWEFTNIVNNSNDSFCVYDSNFKPKKGMKTVDDYWGWWMYRVQQIEEAQKN